MKPSANVWTKTSLKSTVSKPTKRLIKTAAITQNLSKRQKKNALTTHGFDLDSPLVCAGIIGDGCGGGRIFFVQESTLYAHDPVTNEDMKLLEDIQMPQRISKNKCVIFIECKEENIAFNLSSMTKMQS